MIIILFQLYSPNYDTIEPKIKGSAFSKLEAPKPGFSNGRSDVDYNPKVEYIKRRVSAPSFRGQSSRDSTLKRKEDNVYFLFFIFLYIIIDILCEI
jgi:hypothetical protein